MKKILATAVVLAGASHAQADISTIVFEVIATTASGSGSFMFEIDGSTGVDGNFDWTLDAPVTILNQANEEIAVLEGGEISVNDGNGGRGISNPGISVGFTVFASQQQTSFQINSTVLSFTTIPASVAQAQASAGVVLNDLDSNGVTFSPNGGGAYNAFFNNGADQFTSLFTSPINAGTGGGSFSEDTGPFVAPGIDVSSISAAWDFSLSAGDLAVGTSTFTVVPAPASLSLLGLGALAATRRRR